MVSLLDRRRQRKEHIDMPSTTMMANVNISFHV